MKHLLNDLSIEEKNRILEQYNNSLIVETQKFNKLLKSSLGNVKPLLMEEPIEKISYNVDYFNKMLNGVNWIWEKGRPKNNEKDAIDNAKLTLGYAIDNKKYDISNACYFVKNTDGIYAACAYIHKDSINGEDKGCYNPNEEKGEILQGSYDDPNVTELIKSLSEFNFKIDEYVGNCTRARKKVFLSFGTLSTYIIVIKSACGNDPLRFSLETNEKSEQEIYYFDNKQLDTYNQNKPKYSLVELSNFWKNKRYNQNNVGEFIIPYPDLFYDDFKFFVTMYPIN